MKINRNSNCPCNSGKKYKRCCGKKSPSAQSSTLQAGQTQLEPGSYQTPNGFFPSIMCYCASSSDYCLIKGKACFDEEKTAVEMARKNLTFAMEICEGTGNQIDIAVSLKDSGYEKLEHFHISQNP